MFLYLVSHLYVCVQKLAIHTFIEELGISHTYIDIGWWMQLFLPLPQRSAANDTFKRFSYSVYGSGQNRVLLTDFRHIGTWVARIVADPRTLNRSVIVWEDERRQVEAQEVGEKFSGEAEYIRAQRVNVSPSDLFVDIPGNTLELHYSCSHFLPCRSQ